MMNASPQATKGGRLVRTAHGEAQRQALVDAAYHLIASGGFEHLRTRDIAARAGVNIATLHYYFATKEDLIRGVVERVHAELATVYAPSPTGAGRTPLEELRGEFADAQQRMRETPETFVILLELSLRALRDPAIQKMLTEMNTDWQSHVESYLAAGIGQGVFRSDLDVPTAAAVLIATIKGSLMQSMTRQAFPLDRVAAEVERWLTGNAPPSAD